MAQNNQEQPFQTSHGEPRVELLFENQVDLRMNSYRLESLLRQYKEDGDRSRFKDTAPWFIAGIGFLASLLPGDLQDFLGVSSTAWESVLLVGAIACFIMGGLVLFRAIGDRNKRAPNPEQTIAQLIEGMRQNVEGQGRVEANLQETDTQRGRLS